MPSYFHFSCLNYTLYSRTVIYTRPFLGFMWHWIQAQDTESNKIVLLLQWSKCSCLSLFLCFYIYLFIWGWDAYHAMYVEVVGVSSFHPSYSFQGLSSGQDWTWCQVSLCSSLSLASVCFRQAFTVWPRLVSRPWSSSIRHV